MPATYVSTDINLEYLLIQATVLLTSECQSHHYPITDSLNCPFSLVAI